MDGIGLPRWLADLYSYLSSSPYGLLPERFLAVAIPIAVTDSIGRRCTITLYRLPDGTLFEPVAGDDRFRCD